MITLYPHPSRCAHSTRVAPRRASIPRAVGALALIALVGCAASGRPSGRVAPRAGVADTLSTRDRDRTFDVVWNKINETFWDPAVLAARDWPGLRERYRPRALATAGSAEYHRVLHEMVRELRLSHFAVVGPATVRDAWARPKHAHGDLGLRLRVLDGEAVVTRLHPEGAAARAGIRLGFVIDSIDGVATVRMPGAGRGEAAVALALEGPLGSPVRLAYRDSADVRHSLAVARGKRRGRFHRLTLFGIAVPGIPAQYGEVEARRLDGGVGYVRFSMFLLPLGAEVRRAIRAMGNAPGLIIDLRGNPGGQDKMGRDIADLLMDRKAPFIVTRKRNGDEVFHVKPDRPLYRGRVVLSLIHI